MRGFVPVLFPGLLQDAGTLDIGIDGFPVLRQVIMPEFLVFGPALFVFRLFQITDQNFFEGGEGLWILGAETIMAVELHNVIDHHDEAGGIYEAVVNVDVHAVVAFRHPDHGDFHHRDLRRVKLLVRLFL